MPEEESLEGSSENRLDMLGHLFQVWAAATGRRKRHGRQPCMMDSQW